MGKFLATLEQNLILILNKEQLINSKARQRGTNGRRGIDMVVALRI